MAQLFESKGFGTAAEFIAAASDAGPIRDIDPAARDLEGYLFPDTYAMPRHATAAPLVARMVAGFERVAHAEASRRSPGARAERPRARDTCVDRGKGNRQGRGTAARRGGVCQQAENRHGPPVRSDRHLRARARRPVRRQPHARESAIRLTVQHVSVRRACLPVRSRRLARRRSRLLPIRRTFPTSISSAAATVRTLSRRRSTSTIGTFSSSRSSLTGSNYDRW